VTFRILPLSLPHTQHTTMVPHHDSSGDMFLSHITRMNEHKFKVPTYKTVSDLKIVLQKEVLLGNLIEYSIM
jgi:hypothetical protein